MSRLSLQRWLVNVTPAPTSSPQVACCACDRARPHAPKEASPEDSHTLIHHRHRHRHPEIIVLAHPPPPPPPPLPRLLCRTFQCSISGRNILALELPDRRARDHLSGYDLYSSATSPQRPAPRRLPYQWFCSSRSEPEQRCLCRRESWRARCAWRRGGARG